MCHLTTTKTWYKQLKAGRKKGLFCLTIWGWEVTVVGVWDSWSVCMHRQDAESEECWYSARILRIIHSNSVKRMVLPTIKMCFHPQPHAEISSLICVDFSSTILNPVKFPFRASLRGSSMWRALSPAWTVEQKQINRQEQNISFSLMKFSLFAV